MFKKKYDSLISRINWLLESTTWEREWGQRTLVSTFEKVEEQAKDFPDMLEREEYKWLKKEGLKDYLKSSDFETFLLGVELLKKQGVKL